MSAILPINKPTDDTEFHYHPELIALYNSGVIMGVSVGNTLVGAVFVYLLYPYIPQNDLLLWID